MTLIIILIVIVSLLLMLVILAQNAKGGGLSSQFGGSGTSQVVGVKRTTDLLEKITWGLAIALIALTMSTVFFLDKSASGIVSPNIQRAEEQQIVPGFGSPIIEEEGAVDAPTTRPADGEEVADPGVDPSADPTETDLD